MSILISLILLSIDGLDLRGATEPIYQLQPQGIIATDGLVATPSKLTKIPNLSYFAPADLSTTHLCIVPPNDWIAVPIYGKPEAINPVEHTSNLPELCRQAITVCPDWQRPRLEAKFLQLSKTRAEPLAQAVIDNSTTEYIDEIVFVIANSSVSSLNYKDMPSLVVENAKIIYEHDKELDYVEIVELGNHRTTTKYRVTTEIDSGLFDTTYVAIPDSIYYWWIVHPRISDELPYYIQPGRNGGSNRPRPPDKGGVFWRTFLWDANYTEEPDTNHYMSIKDIMEGVTVLWDHKRDGGGRRVPLEEMTNACKRILQWSAYVMVWDINQAYNLFGNAERAVQPVEIWCNHYGHCGEIQDIIAAGGRVALIPFAATSNGCEDHVWNEFWWDNNWYTAEVGWYGDGFSIDSQGTGWDSSHGGSKDISGVYTWRGDNVFINRTERYSDVCTLVVKVIDRDTIPVPGAKITIYSEGWQTTEYFTVASGGVTDINGMCTFLLGNNQNFYANVASTLGVIPSSNSFGALLENTVVNTRYDKTIRIPSNIPEMEYEQTYQTSQGALNVSGSSIIRYGYFYSPDTWDSGFSLIPNWSPSGLETFVATQDEWQKIIAAIKPSLTLLTGQAVRGEWQMKLPHEQLFYIIFYNPNPYEGQVLDLSVNLSLDLMDVDNPIASNVTLKPQVARDRILRFMAPEASNYVIDCFDLKGRMVVRLDYMAKLIGDQELRLPKSLSSGVYLVSIHGEKINPQIAKLTILD